MVVLSSLPYVIRGIANGCGGLLSDWLVRRLGLRRGRRAVGVFGLGTAAISSVAFGYIATYFGSYNAPFFPMVATLSLGALLWLRVDPTRDLFEEEKPLVEALA